MKVLEDGFFQAISEPDRAMRVLSRLNEPSSFYLCLGGTEVSDIEGISAAGSTPALRRQTPAVDAEALILGRTLTHDKLPVSPIGVVSPVVITRACLRMCDVTPKIIDCGSFSPPLIDLYNAGSLPAKSVSCGQAMPLNMVIELFTRGFDFGIKESGKRSTFVLSECVPGGTTTALAVLTGLGYEARYSLSSSMPNSDHEARWREVTSGLTKSGLRSALDPFVDLVEVNPFEVLAAVGDPMQPFLTGMTLAVCQRHPVVLAGGSQMLAVYALCLVLAQEYGVDMAKADVGLITTKWVAFDPNAALAALAKTMQAPLAASCPDFLKSRHAGLRAYEAGNVKEGVGAGAALAMGYIHSQYDHDVLMQAIDHCYDQLVSTMSVSA